MRSTVVSQTACVEQPCVRLQDAAGTPLQERWSKCLQGSVPIRLYFCAQIIQTFNIHTQNQAVPPLTAPPALWWLDCEDADILNEQRLSFEKLNNLNADIPPGSRRPREYIGLIEHFRNPDSRDNSTLDRITVYQNDTMEPGAKLQPLRTFFSDTSWSECDGLPTRCCLMDVSAIQALQPIGLQLVAMPCTGGSEQEFVLSASPAGQTPGMHYSSHEPQNARLQYAVNRLLEQYRPDSCDETDNCTLPETPAKARAHDKEGREGTTSESVHAPLQVDLDKPESWIFPADDSDEEEWSNDRAPTLDQQFNNVSLGLNGPDIGVFSESDSDDDAWSTDSDNDS